MSEIKDIIKKNELYYTANSFAVFVYEKLEKISVAIYLVTDFLSDKEPLKFHTRDKSIKLMSFMMSLKNNFVSLSEESFLETESLISEIRSSLKILVTTKMLSEMNYSILDNELKNVLDLVKERRQEGVGRKIFLSADFFKETNSFKEEIEEFSIGHYSKGHQGHKGQESFETNVSEIDIKNIKDKQNDFGREIKIKKTNDLKQLPSSKKVEVKTNSSRKDSILKIIKDKKEVTIKDIAKQIKNCSEKTIQRELTILLKDKVIKKEGERRWSKYSLNN